MHLFYLYILSPKVNLRFYRKFTVFAKYYFTKEISIELYQTCYFTEYCSEYYFIILQNYDYLCNYFIERFSRISEIIKQAK